MKEDGEKRIELCSLFTENVSYSDTRTSGGAFVQVRFGRILRLVSGR
jgi:hypothetical protein